MHRSSPRTENPTARGQRRTIRVASASCALALTVLAATTGTVTQAATRAPRATSTTYPAGTFDSKEPSYMAPPTPGAMPGYARAYVNDFLKPLTSQWYLFSGRPKGDPVGRFEVSHVQEKAGILELGTWRDPKYKDQWATGGVCLCSVHPTYGAFFVRSKQVGIGPDDAELLWPSNNTWPPEVDFNETGNTARYSAWFDHYTPAPDAFHFVGKVDVTNWHTWGVVWTPTSLTFVLDGKARGTVVTTADGIPTMPMTLDLQSQTWCGIYPECPKANSELEIDWVAIFTPTPPAS